MGQRLNIEILENGKPLANAYYHWSAYTYPAMELTKTILDNLKSIEDDNSVLRAIRLLETTGALLKPSEVQEAAKKIPNETFQEATNRNDGLISFTKKEMQVTKDWEEGCVQIDLTEGTISFDVLYCDTKNDFMILNELEESDFYNLPLYKGPTDFINFYEFIDWYSTFIHYMDQGIDGVRTLSDEVILFID